MSSYHHGRLAAAAIAAATAALALPGGAQGMNGLVGVKTAQFKSVVQMAGKDGKLTPFVTAVARLSLPDKVYLELTSSTKTEKPSFYVTDGKTEVEYYGDSNTYRTLPLPGAGPPSQMCAIASIREILDLDHQFAKDGAEKGVTRTFAREALDGKPMIVRTDTQPERKAEDGSTVVYFDRFWIDATTHLPYRRTGYLTRDGKTTPTLQEQLSDWVLDKPIPAAQFTFVPPPGSKVFSIPTMIGTGAKAPDFTVSLPDNKTVRLSDYRGKVVVLDLWATWCGPCQHSMPHLEHVYQQIERRSDVAVLAVCVWDTKDNFTQWIAANMPSKYNFPVAFDPAGKDSQKSFANKLYRVSGVPTQYVIDRDGKIAAVISGYRDGEHRLEDALRSLGIPVAPTEGTQQTRSKP